MPSLEETWDAGVEGGVDTAQWMLDPFGIATQATTGAPNQFQENTREAVDAVSERAGVDLGDPAGDDPDDPGPFETIAEFLRLIIQNADVIAMGTVALVIIHVIGGLFTFHVGDGE